LEWLVRGNGNFLITYIVAYKDAATNFFSWRENLVSYFFSWLFSAARSEMKILTAQKVKKDNC